MLVVDTVLEPASVEQLPRLETQHPISDSSWDALLDLIEGPAASGGASGSDAVAAAGAPTPAAAAGASAAADAWFDAGAADEADVDISPEQQRRQRHAQRTGPDFVMPVEAPPPPPPADPDAPPDCATLAGSGQLMLAVNGSLITTGCRAAAVISSGTTQTAVSDAGQAGATNLGSQSLGMPRSLELELPLAAPEAGGVGRRPGGAAAPLAVLLACLLLLLGGWLP